MVPSGGHPHGCAVVVPVGDLTTREGPRGWGPVSLSLLLLSTQQREGPRTTGTTGTTGTRLGVRAARVPVTGADGCRSAARTGTRQNGSAGSWVRSGADFPGRRAVVVGVRHLGRAEEGETARSV